MTQQNDLEIELSDGRILQAFVETTWVYERNPGDKESAFYRGEDDGYHIEDWQFIGDCVAGGVPEPFNPTTLTNEEYALVEKAVERLSYEN